MTLTKAVMKALGCNPGPFRRGCSLHFMGWDDERQECKRAQEAARRLEELLPELAEERKAVRG